MRNVILPKLLIAVFFLATFLQSCKDDAYLQTPPVVPKQDFKEGCDNINDMLAKGWKFGNHSFPKGGGVWQNGGNATAPLFNAYTPFGSYAGFIGTDVSSTMTPTPADAAPYTLAAPAAPQGFINNYLFSPELMMKNGDKIIFYTRSQLLGGATAADSTDWGNRLQVRINPHGSDMYVGDIKNYWYWLYTSSTTTEMDNAGNYDVVLLDINRDMHEWHKVAPGVSVIDSRAYNANTNILAYPTQWTRFEATVQGLTEPIKSRFAFRYVVPGGDPNNGYASGIGIDNIEYISN